MVNEESGAPGLSCCRYLEVWLLCVKAWLFFFLPFFFFLFSNPKEQWFVLICSFTLLQHRHSAGIPFVRILQLFLLFGSLLVFFFLLLGKGWRVGGEMSVGRWGEGQKLTRVSEGVFYWKIIL